MQGIIYLTFIIFLSWSGFTIAITQDEISPTSHPTAFNKSLCIKASYYTYDFSQTTHGSAGKWRKHMFDEMGQGFFAPNGKYVEATFNTYVASTGNNERAANLVWSSFSCDQWISGLIQKKYEPIVKINPRFPSGVSKSQEGWVKLTFSINTIGGTEDIKVLDASPKRIFDEEAIRALRKWKFRPQSKKVIGESVELKFKYNQ